MGPFFSIITPSYNRASLISGTINSLLAQTFTDWELLIVDDGSTDNTKQVVSAYTDKRIRYIYQQNAERSAARNNGIEQATGSYVSFLDSDDYYLPNRLELLHAEIVARNQPNTVFYTGIAFSHNGLIKEAPVLENTFTTFGDFIVQAVIGNPQVCASRAIFKAHHFDPRFHIGEDMELWLRIGAQHPFTYLPNQYTIVAVEHDDRSVNVARYNSYVDQLRMLRYVFSPPHPGQYVSAPVKAKLLGNCFYGIARYHIYNNNRFAAAKEILRAILTDTASVQLKFRVNVLLKLLSLSSMHSVRELIKF